jgi:hypothetical protein
MTTNIVNVGEREELSAHNMGPPVISAGEDENVTQARRFNGLAPRFPDVPNAPKSPETAIKAIASPLPFADVKHQADRLIDLDSEHYNYLYHHKTYPETRSEENLNPDPLEHEERRHWNFHRVRPYSYSEVSLIVPGSADTRRPEASGSGSQTNTAQPDTTQYDRNDLGDGHLPLFYRRPQRPQLYTNTSVASSFQNITESQGWTPSPTPSRANMTQYDSTQYDRRNTGGFYSPLVIRRPQRPQLDTNNRTVASFLNNTESQGWTPPPPLSRANTTQPDSTQYGRSDIGGGHPPLVIRRLQRPQLYTNNRTVASLLNNTESQGWTPPPPSSQANTTQPDSTQYGQSDIGGGHPPLVPPLVIRRLQRPQLYTNNRTVASLLNNTESQGWTPPPAPSANTTQSDSTQYGRSDTGGGYPPLVLRRHQRPQLSTNTSITPSFQDITMIRLDTPALPSPL